MYSYDPEDFVDVSRSVQVHQVLPGPSYVEVLEAPLPEAELRHFQSMSSFQCQGVPASPTVGVDHQYAETNFLEQEMAIQYRNVQRVTSQLNSLYRSIEESEQVLKLTDLRKRPLGKYLKKRLPDLVNALSRLQNKLATGTRRWDSSSETSSCTEEEVQVTPKPSRPVPTEKQQIGPCTEAKMGPKYNDAKYTG